MSIKIGAYVPTKTRILFFLSSVSRPVGFGELVERMGVERDTVYFALKSLLYNGLIVNRTDGYVLSDKGWELVKRIRELICSDASQP